MPPKKTILYVMGVSSTGKSTVGKMLATKIAFPFFDGDDYHPKENIEKMASGNPLTDENRAAWLKKLNQLAQKHKETGAVIACSALKQKYRDVLTEELKSCSVFIFLQGSFEEIRERMQQRENHFMPLSLLQSQFDTLELPTNAIEVSVAKAPEEIVQYIMENLNGYGENAQ